MQHLGDEGHKVYWDVVSNSESSHLRCPKPVEFPTVDKLVVIVIFVGIFIEWILFEVHHKQCDSKRKDINLRTILDGKTLVYFRCDVGIWAYSLLRNSRVRQSRQLKWETEVYEAQINILVDQSIFELYIAVCNASWMYVVQYVEELNQVETTKRLVELVLGISYVAE